MFKGEHLVETTTGHARVEYYAPLSRAGQERAFTYRWPGKAPPGGVRFEVQQPVGADGLAIDPPPAWERVDARGVVHHQGSFAAFEAPTLSLRYTKATEGLTVDALRSGAAAGATPKAPAQTPPRVLAESGPDTVSPWAVVGIAVLSLLAMAAIFGYRVPAAR